MNMSKWLEWFDANICTRAGSIFSNPSVRILMRQNQRMEADQARMQKWATRPRGL
jgi:hypothetical protein